MYHPSLTQVGEIIQTANTPTMGAAIMMVCLLVAKHSCLLHSATKKGLCGPRETVHHRLTKETEDNFQRLSQKLASRHNSTIVNIHSVEFFPPARL